VQKKGKEEKAGKVIFNKELLDATVLENREELDLIENLKEGDLPAHPEKNDSTEGNEQVQ
jgi:hypothetical protein